MSTCSLDFFSSLSITTITTFRFVALFLIKTFADNNGCACDAAAFANCIQHNGTS